ncbi:hypothetical protein IFR05_002788 [Cadophora sp. M221]|nr:hypothetical protein IFR05_002788 [Cadophora sp. M221]
MFTFNLAQVLSPKGSTINTPLFTYKRRDLDDEDMPDALESAITKLKEILRVKLLDTFSGNRRELETWLLQVELY